MISEEICYSFVISFW